MSRGSTDCSNNSHVPAAAESTEVSPHALQLTGVRARYGDGPWVVDVEQLTVNRGERVAIIGPSGSGKTSLLRLINGYVPAVEGQLQILGRTPRDQGRRRSARTAVAFIFQEFHLVDRASVFDNVLWGRLGHVHPLSSLLGRFPLADKRAAMEAIAEVDLTPQATQRADTLSGGQKQRVGVARALAQEPQILLADEPVSNLDPALADDILELLVRSAERRNATLLLTLHQPELARRHADRIVGMREGHVVHDGRSGDLTDADLKRIYGREGIPQLEPRESSARRA